MQFLQLGEVQAHRSALRAAKEQELHVLGVSKVLMHATTASYFDIDDTVHMVHPESCTTDEHEIAVWGYLMMQYNLKPGLRKFRECRATAAVSELTQLHVMNMRLVMDPTKLTRNNRAKALLLLLFLKEKQYRKIKGRAYINGAP